MGELLTFRCQPAHLSACIARIRVLLNKTKSLSENTLATISLIKEVNHPRTTSSGQVLVLFYRLFMTRIV